ncbi:MAG TPA: DUF4157 domain-containing protein [Actinomycetes bacterium]
MGNRAIAELLRPGSARHLDPGLRAFMEARLGYDLGHVRVRTDAAAAAAAAALDADAFAVGGDVVFGAGRYEPGTSEGRRLLAHELAHAVQQRDHPGVGAARAAGLRVDPSEQAEHAADAVAGSVAAGPIPTLPVTAGTLGAPAVQRQAASARERARGRPPEIAPQVVQEMKGDVERIVERLRQQVLPSSQEWEIVGLVRKWAEADARDRERTGHGETGHLDRFLAELKRRVYSRSTARSGWVEQWASAYDDLWYELEDERLEAFKELVATSRTQAGTGPLSQRTANLWGVLGKQEAIGLWGMLKGMGTGAAGLVDEGAWAVTKALRAQGVDVADPESAAAWLEEQYDFSGEVMFGAEWKSGEKLFLGMSAAEIGTSGGGIIWQLVMLGSGKTAPAWVKGALRVFGIASNLKGINDSASAIADIIAKRQEKGPVDFAKLLQDAAFLEQVTKLTANVVGAIAAGRTSSTQAGQATAAALSRIGILLDGAQASAQIGRLIEIATSEMSSQAKEEAAGKVVVQLIHSGIAIATGAKSHHEEFGGKQQRPSTQTTAVPPTKPPAKAPAPPGPPGRRPPGVTEIVGEPVILPSKPKGKVVGSTAEASATPSTEPVVLTDERGRVVGEKPVAPKGKTVGLVNPERQRVYEKGKRRGEPLPEQRTKEQRAAFEKALGPFRQPAKAGPAKGGATEVPPPPLVLSPQAAAAKPPPAEGPVILGPDKKPMRGAPASPGFVRAPSGEQVVAGARVRLDEPLGVAVPPGTTRYGTEAQSVIINRRYPGPDVTPLPFAFPAFDAVQGGTVTPVLAGQGRAGALKKGVRIEGGTAISIKAIDAAAAKSYATAESTYSSMKPWVDVAADYPGGGAVSLSQDVGGEPVQYTVVNPTKRVLHVELAVTPTNEQMDGFARLRNYAEDRGVELRLVAPNQVRPRP